MPTDRFEVSLILPVLGAALGLGSLIALLTCLSVAYAAQGISQAFGVPEYVTQACWAVASLSALGIVLGLALLLAWAVLAAAELLRSVRKVVYGGVTA